MNEKRERIAIIGAGVAGITAAHILQRAYSVTLFEKNKYTGGHTQTIELQDSEAGDLAIDTGFIVLNDQTYPNLHTLLDQLDVSVRDSDMSFGFYCRKTGLQYAGTGWHGLFAQRGNLLKPSYYRFLNSIVRFNQVALNDIEQGTIENRTLRDYLEEKNTPTPLIQNYLIPMGAAIWSTAHSSMLDFPAETFFRFFKNHGLLSFQNRPQWQTVVGGSYTYVKSFTKRFSGTLRTDCPIQSVKRLDEGVQVVLSDNQVQLFDKAILACHADEALHLLSDPSPDERRLLGTWKYNRNHTLLHTDTGVMPPNRRAWASWNYTRGLSQEGETRLSVTYHMNRLQGLATRTNYFVTLNPDTAIHPDLILREFMYTHPLFTREAIQSQAHLPRLNGVHRTYFCGSYFGYGFHEDAVRSGIAVAQTLGLDL